VLVVEGYGASLRHECQSHCELVLSQHRRLRSFE
jgi:hypothetical protein